MYSVSVLGEGVISDCFVNLEIIEDSHGRKSIIIGSQLPVAKWYEVIGDSTVADAILDRIVHTARLIELKGESLIKK